jgi:phosphatidylserine/phosphatidylglycerophosphate/cardiolipin synthase-like enzyme
MVAVLAAATFSVAGCVPLSVHGAGTHKHRTGAPEHGTRAHKAGATHRKARGATPGGTGVLVTEPHDGFSPVYRLINGAKHSIDMTMYELADTRAEHDLAAAARRGARVRVILGAREKSENSPAYDFLRSHRVKAVWSSPTYFYTHQKTLVIDHAKAVIMTANLTSRYYSTSRDFAVIDSSKADVAAIERVFRADYAHASVTPGDGRDLVWSPTDSEAKLLALINGARSSLRIYSEEMSDTTVEKALMRAARRGVTVRVCGENQDGEYDSDFAELARAGVRISYYSSSDGFYIHGKVVEADYGTRRAKIFIGSENFSNTSLNQNRELGLIISRHRVLSSIARTFAADFRNGKHVSP